MFDDLLVLFSVDRWMGWRGWNGATMALQYTSLRCFAHDSSALLCGMLNQLPTLTDDTDADPGTIPR
jgi:hypothetical protein